MQARRAVFAFVSFALLGFAIAGRASPPCEPLALRLAVTSVAVDGAAATPSAMTFFLEDLGGGNFGGSLFDPDTGTRKKYVGTYRATAAQ